MLENRHNNIILEFNGGGSDELWEVYPLLWESESESESEFNYQRIRNYVNSCNGLLLFFDENDGEAYICNPTTNESKAIPLPPIVNFPPPNFSSFWGCSALGFDSRSNDYKFIIAVDHVSAGAGCNSLARYVELYSLKTDSWKSLTIFPNILFTEPCVYTDGSIYWLSHLSHHSIDAFDLADETFSSFDINHLLPAESYRLRLAEDCGGSDHHQLGLVAYKIKSPDNCFELWIKTAGAGWNINKRWDFSLPGIGVINHPARDLIILGFSGGILYLAAADGEIFAYDCAGNRLEKLQLRLRKYTRHPVFVTYVETTVSPLSIS